MAAADVNLIASGVGAALQGFLQFLLVGSLPDWLQPVWFLFAGLAVGLAILAAIWGVLRLAWPSVARELAEILLQGLSRPLILASVLPAALAVIGIPLAPLDGFVTSAGQWSDNARLLAGTAASLLGIVTLYAALHIVFPKVAVIALTTAKEGMAQPLFWVCLGLGGFALILFTWIPYLTFGDDIKMLKDTGLVLIMILSIVLALWNASQSVASEIEGRTALTLLSKPIGRRQFIIGKFLGILGPLVVLFFVLGIVFLGTVSYKVIYDIREGSGVRATDTLTLADICRMEMVQIVPGLALSFMEAAILAAISVAISTRLPLLANLLICFAIYVVGHLVPLLVNSAVGKLEIVQFVGQLIATIFPVLDHFNIQPAVAGGKVVPASYLLVSAGYCGLYCCFALVVALLLFEDRDLA
jgi:ABC-type transport system involved in multi-copper enzyme maturation permease subunit